MKRTMLLAASAAFNLLIAGCTSIGSAPTSEVDTAYVAYVEQAARRNGTQVIWGRLPMRPVAPPLPEQNKK